MKYDYNNMSQPDDLKQLGQIEDTLKQKRNVGVALRLIHRFLDAFHKSDADGRIADVENSYELMKHYTLMGLDDPQRDALYEQLLGRLETWLHNMRVDCRVQASPVLAVEQRLLNGEEPSADNVESRLESFVTDMALLSLEPEDKRKEKEKSIRRKHYDYLNALFMALVISHQWSHDTARQFANVVLAPSVEPADALFITSALLMATLFEPDAEKTWALMAIYGQATSEPLRQRALVGWVFSLMYADFDADSQAGRMAAKLLADPDMRDCLLEMQLQVIYCQNTEKDTDEIRRDVLPTLLKNQDSRLSSFGIGLIDESSMEDILHPDEADKRMEKLEKSIQRMAEMRKKGVDIYFDGFAQMKRFSFFHKASNWFMPFSQDHPDLPAMPDDLSGSAFLGKLFGEGPFCDSDKYSFVIGLSTVFAKLPAPVREMLKNGNAEMTVLGAEGEVEHGADYIRRMYLQDLYRFFKLSDSRTLFHNPFGDIGPMLFFAKPLLLPLLRDKIGPLARFLRKRELFSQMNALSDALLFNPVLEPNSDDAVDMLLLDANLALHNFSVEAASKFLEQARMARPDDMKVLREYAMVMFRIGKYQEACDAYERLSTQFPDNVNYAMSWAITLIYCGKAEQALGILYKLDYEHPEHEGIKRALAWGLLWNDRAAQALKMYESIVADKKATPDDWLNAGYAAWLSGDREKAQRMFAKYAGQAGLKQPTDASDNPLLAKFKTDLELLRHYGIGDTEMKIMADC